MRQPRNRTTARSSSAPRMTRDLEDLGVRTRERGAAAPPRFRSAQRRAQPAPQTSGRCAIYRAWPTPDPRSWP
jgi:hypothetical protein